MEHTLPALRLLLLHDTRVEIFDVPGCPDFPGPRAGGYGRASVDFEGQARLCCRHCSTFPCPAAIAVVMELAQRKEGRGSSATKEGGGGGSQRKAACVCHVHTCVYV
jgi:hypothetical protein